MSAAVIEMGEAPISMAEARDWLRLGPSEADANVAGLIRAATNLCELFTGQMLVERAVSEIWVASEGWRDLARQPVVGVEEVIQIDGASGPVILTDEQWDIESQADGGAALRLAAEMCGRQVQVRYRAGLATSAGAIPEAVRHGILRLVQHWHFGAGPGDAVLPAIVTALWMPWRRVSLGGGR